MKFTVVFIGHDKPMARVEGLTVEEVVEKRLRLNRNGGAFRAQLFLGETLVGAVGDDGVFLQLPPLTAWDHLLQEDDGL